MVGGWVVVVVVVGASVVVVAMLVVGTTVVVVVVDVVLVDVVGLTVVVVDVMRVAAVFVTGGWSATAREHAPTSSAMAIVTRMTLSARLPGSDTVTMSSRPTLFSPPPTLSPMAGNRRSVRRAVMVLLVGSLIIPLTVSAGALPPGGTFLDDDFNIHEGNIEAIAADDITRGCNPPVYDRFCPTSDVRRGEMAAFLNRALDLPAATKDYFLDDNTSIFEDNINRLAEAGITRGCNPPTNDRFCPDSTVNRGSMAAFLVRGYGYSAGVGSNLFVDDDTSIFENDIDRLGTAGVTLGCNPPANDRFCPNDPVRRDQMASFLARAEGLDPMVPPPRADLMLEVFASGLSQPVGLVAPDDPADDRVFVLEKGGTIRIIEGDGTVLPTPFLTIPGVLNGGETGLLGMTFHPDYPSDGRFFVHYSMSGGTGSHRTRIASFTVSGNPNIASTTETILLTVDQPRSNHNGGDLAFGPDGFLYIGFGDGGSQHDPDQNGRDPTTLLASILRVNVDSGSPYSIPADNPYVGVAGLDEVWSIGLRNPWRFVFDGDQLYIGDVGQDDIEEVDVVTVVPAGYDFGWSQYEGTRCHTELNDPADIDCSTAGITFPVLEYGHSEGFTVIGGRVYRGSDLVQLDGHYFYGDLAGWIRSFRVIDGVAYNKTDWAGDLPNVGGLVSFGSDSSGELYVVSIGGTVYKLAAES